MGVQLKVTEKKAKAQQRKDGSASQYVGVAKIIFKDEKAATDTLAAANGRLLGSTVLPLARDGLRNLMQAEKDLYKDPEALQQEVDNFMAVYEEREEQAKKEKTEQT